MTVGTEELIGYCGLYCGDCFGYKGIIPDLARKLRQELKREKFDIILQGIPFKALQDYKQSYAFLGALTRLQCTSGCRSGGGNPFCQVRKCCQKNDIHGCWECGEFETCGKLDFLKKNHGNAHFRNLRQLKKKGVADFLQGKRFWISRAKKSS